MASTLRDRLDAVPLKPLAAKPGAVCTSLKSLEDAKRELGRLVGRAFDLGALKKQAVAADLGYADQTIVSRWIAGLDAAPLGRLMQIREFRRGLLLALAEDAGAGVKTTTVITIEGAA